MKQVSCILYVLCTAVYLLYAEPTLVWFGFGLMTILSFIIALGYMVLHPTINSNIERLLLHYAIYLTIGRVIYTGYCIYCKDSIVIYNTDVFALITCVTSLILISHIAFHFKKYS